MMGKRRTREAVMLKNKNLLSILLLILQTSLFAEETITYKVATKSNVFFMWKIIKNTQYQQEISEL